MAKLGIVSRGSSGNKNFITLEISGGKYNKKYIRISEFDFTAFLEKIVLKIDVGDSLIEREFGSKISDSIVPK